MVIFKICVGSVSRVSFVIISVLDIDARFVNLNQNNL